MLGPSLLLVLFILFAVSCDIPEVSLERENIAVLDRGLSAFREKLNIYLHSIDLGESCLMSAKQ